MANGFSGFLGGLPQLLWSNVAGTVQVRARKIIVGTNLTLTDNADGSAGLSAAGASLTVAEADASPTVTGVTSITVSNGTLTDNGSGSVTLTTGGGGGGGSGTFDLTVHNATGSSIAAGKIVNWAYSVTSGVPNVTLASNTNTTGFGSSFGITTGSIADGASGTVRILGAVTGLDTHLFSVGADIFAGASGAFSSNGNNGNWVGGVLVSDASTGSIFVGSLISSLAYVTNHGHGSPNDGGPIFTFGAVIEDFLDLVEIPEPASPAAGRQRYWVDSTSHILKAKTSAGVVRSIG